jgi:pectin methylesterase-like acyl-CoA thioesterase
MLKKRTTFLSLGLLLFGTACALADEGGRGGKTLTVGQSGANCPNAQYTTIGAAVSAANSGDVVEICPALYAEQLVITKPLTLVGIEVNGVNRVLLQPSLTVLANLATEGRDYCDEYQRCHHSESGARRQSQHRPAVATPV